MNVSLRILLALLALAIPAMAQQPGPPAQLPNGRIYLDVVVTARSGPPVAGLGQGDFTLLDNKLPQTITSFKAVSGRQAPIEIVLLVDAVNTSYQTIAFARSQIDKFLRADGGHLAHPTALAIFTDTGTQIQQGFSTDGNATAASLDQYVIGLRSIRRSSEYGAADRFDLSLRALSQLVAREGPRPGRKIILWISPGWPLLSGPRVDLSSKLQQQLFTNVVDLSTRLREGRITLYSINPIGASESPERNFYYEEFLKGVARPTQVNAGNLGLQVLAVQSGGLVLNSSNDVTALLQQAAADTDAYYELSFDSAPPEGANEYHRLEIQVSKPGLTARTRQGYYAQPPNR